MSLPSLQSSGLLVFARQPNGPILQLLTKAGYPDLRATTNIEEFAQHLAQAVTVDAAPGVVIVAGDVDDVDLDRVHDCLDATLECLHVSVLVIAGNGRHKPLHQSVLHRARLVELLPPDLTAEALGQRVSTASSCTQLLRAQQQATASTDQRLEALDAERRNLLHQLRHDELTGLENGTELHDVLKELARSSSPEDTGLAVLHFDIDRFKLMNDALGHDVGDMLLLAVAKVLRRRGNVLAHVARVGADSFAAIMVDVGRDQALTEAERLRREMAVFHLAGEEPPYRVGVSIGVAVEGGFGHGVDGATLLRHAEHGCLSAKAQGGNRVHLFSHRDAEVLRQQGDAFWIPRIRYALNRGRLRLLFQPVQRLCDHRITHYETLVRMEAANGALSSPDQFIPVAERYGLIHDIDQWVVSTAVNRLATLPAHYCLSINLSGLAFEDRSLVTRLARHLERTKVSPNRLTFEITETAAIENLEQTKSMLQAIRRLGCKLALDDFGKGYNTLVHLKRFPFDVIKIDGSFIQNLANDAFDQVLVRSMVSVAQTLGKKTVAEFVETPAVYAQCEALGIDYAQGRLIGMPGELVEPV